MDITKEASGKNREIEFTIDGRRFTLVDPDQTAASLLTLAGLNPNGYDLGELHGNGPQPKRYSDNDKVHVQNNDRYVSIRESATVA